MIIDLFRPKKSTGNLINKWKENPESYFKGLFNEPLEWNTCYGLAPFEGLPDSHGYSQMPDMKCVIPNHPRPLIIGWVEKISMYSGGTVRIKHFALENEFTNIGLGVKFLGSIIRFFKSHNAIKIEFHETHKTKIEHYKIFFEKYGVKEKSKGVWIVEPYKYTRVPDSVTTFHKNIENPHK